MPYPISKRQIALKLRTHDLIDESGIQHRQVARLCSWSPEYLSAILSPRSRRKIKRTHIAKIASATGYDEDLFYLIDERFSDHEKEVGVYEYEEPNVIYPSLQSLLSNQKLMSKLRLSESEISELAAIRLRKYRPTEQFWLDVIKRMRKDEKSRR